MSGKSAREPVIPTLAMHKILIMDDKIQRLEEFINSLKEWKSSYQNEEKRSKIRSQINKIKPWVRQQVLEAKCLHTVTIAPPPAVGGLVMDNIDPFTMIFNAPYGMSLISVIVDMVEQTIGVLNAPPAEKENSQKYPAINISIKKNYAFIAMTINPDIPELEDVLDAIKEGSSRCGIIAERVDEVESNDRITDRILVPCNSYKFG